MNRRIKLATVLLSTLVLTLMLYITATLTPGSVIGSATANSIVNGWNVGEVHFGGGSFVDQGNKAWVENGQEGEPRFEFVEQGRDEWSVYLRDDSRNIGIQLDLHRKMIIYIDPAGKRSDLYVIQDSFAESLSDPTRIGQPASAQIVEYTCNEGIPLLLTFENIGDDSFVTWTHDGFTGNPLPNVISASGVKYSDGKNTVWTKGNEVYVNLDGIEDSCTEIN